MFPRDNSAYHKKTSRQPPHIYQQTFLNVICCLPLSCHFQWVIPTQALIGSKAERVMRWSYCLTEYISHLKFSYSKVNRKRQGEQTIFQTDAQVQYGGLWSFLLVVYTSLFDLSYRMPRESALLQTRRLILLQTSRGQWWTLEYVLNCALISVHLKNKSYVWARKG